MAGKAVELMAAKELQRESSILATFFRAHDRYSMALMAPKLLPGSYNRVK